MRVSKAVAALAEEVAILAVVEFARRQAPNEIRAGNLTLNHEIYDGKRGNKEIWIPVTKLSLAKREHVYVNRTLRYDRAALITVRTKRAMGAEK